MDEQTDAWMTREEVATRLRLPSKTLARWASQGKGPRYCVFGRHARYKAHRRNRLGGGSIQRGRRVMKTPQITTALVYPGAPTPGEGRCNPSLTRDQETTIITYPFGRAVLVLDETIAQIKMAMRGQIASTNEHLEQMVCDISTALQVLGVDKVKAGINVGVGALDFLCPVCSAEPVHACLSNDGSRVVWPHAKREAVAYRTVRGVAL